VDETPLAGESPRALVNRLSRSKALAGASAQPGHGDALVIGSDQVAVLGEDILGKPGTEENARAQLSRLSGQCVTFLTGLCLVNTGTGSERQALIETPVWFRQLTAAQIANYVAREQPLDCAGAFKSEGLGIALFERMGGPDPNALIGLPLIELCTMLEAEGLAILGDR
jgi:MAF protein